jgi:hypothetical protein
MVNEQHLCLLDNKDRDSEINLVVNMRHGVLPATLSPQYMCSDPLSPSPRQAWCPAATVDCGISC